MTIPASEETTNTQRFEEDSWLMSQSTANQSLVLNSLLAGKMQGIFANLSQIRRKMYG
jgi:hypothetical protein